MDTTRYEELTTKKDQVGLTDDEADELARMIAELEGQVYKSADTLHPHEEAQGAGDTASQRLGPCGHVGCGCDVPFGFCGPFCQAHAHEPSARGPAEGGCDHDACRIVVGEA